MLCAIYRSPKKEGMYLYIAKRDDFKDIPEVLMKTFGKPQFAMLFNLKGEKQLKVATNKEVMESINTQGFYLQLPPLPEDLLKQFKE